MKRRSIIRGNIGIIFGVAILLAGLLWYMVAGRPSVAPLFKQIETIAKPVAGFAENVIWILAALVVALILGRAWVRRKRPQLIIEKFSACGGDDVTAKSDHHSAVQLHILSLEFRDHLVQVERRIGYALRYPRKEHGGSEGYQYGGPDKYQVSEDLARPLSTMQDASRGFEISLPGEKGANAQWAVQLLNLLFPPHLITVRGVVRCDERTSQPAAISFEAVDTRLASNNRALNFEIKLEPPVTTSKPGEILVDLSSKVLAIKLLREELLNFAPRRPWRRERFQAEAHHIAGMLYTTYFKDYLRQQRPGECIDFLYKKGYENFNRAIEYDSSWYKPYAALADLHSIKGQAQQLGQYPQSRQDPQSKQTGTALQYQATSEYDLARKLLDQETKGWWSTACARFADQLYKWEEQHDLQPTSPWYRLRLAIAKGVDRIIFHTTNRLEYAHHMLLIKVGKARAQVLTGDLDEASLAVSAIWDIEDSTHGHHKERLARFLDYQVLYYLACWHATAYRIRDESYRRLKRAIAWQRPEVILEDREAQRVEALTYLARSLVRNAAGLADTGILDNEALADEDAIEDPSWSYWKRADNDPDLDPLRHEINVLKDAIIRHLQTDRQLFNTVGPAFEDKLTRILVAAGVLSGVQHSGSSRTDMTSLRPLDHTPPTTWSPLDLHRYSTVAYGTGSTPPRRIAEQATGGSP